MRQELARKVVARWSAFREEVGQRISRANTASERAVMRAGACLDAIVERARSHVAVTESLRRYTAEADGSILEAMERQRTAVVELTRELDGLFARQRSETAAALGQLSAITDAGREIGKLVGASRMLALNAKLEAARLGDAGRTFGTVASEMKTLSHEIERANRSVEQMVRAMTTTLPALAARAAEMEARSKRFSEAFEGHAAEVHEGITMLESAINRVLESGATSIDEIIPESQSALSALQFQDAEAQALAGLDALAHDLVEETAEELEVEALPQRAPAVRRLGGDDGAPAVESGEVLLF